MQIKGLQPHDEVFNAADHTIGHGQVVLDEKGNIVKEGKAVRFDQYAQQAVNSVNKQLKDQLSEQAKQIAELQAQLKALASKQSEPTKSDKK